MCDSREHSYRSSVIRGYVDHSLASIVQVGAFCALRNPDVVILPRDNAALVCGRIDEGTAAAATTRVGFA